MQRRLNVRCDQRNSNRTVNALQRHARSRNNKNKNGQLNPDHLHKEVAVRAEARNHKLRTPMTRMKPRIKSAFIPRHPRFNPSFTSLTRIEYAAPKPP